MINQDLLEILRCPPGDHIDPVRCCRVFLAWSICPDRGTAHINSCHGRNGHSVHPFLEVDHSRGSADHGRFADGESLARTDGIVHFP